MCLHQPHLHRLDRNLCVNVPALASQAYTELTCGLVAQTSLVVACNSHIMPLLCCAQCECVGEGEKWRYYIFACSVCFTHCQWFHIIRFIICACIWVFSELCVFWVMDKYPAATLQSKQSARDQAGWKSVCVCYVLSCLCFRTQEHIFTGLFS